MASANRSPAGRERVRVRRAARLDAWDVPHQRRHVATDASLTHVLMAGRHGKGRRLAEALDQVVSGPAIVVG
ncbi:hypothetical protein [Streptomyces sp. NPDC002640]